VLLAIDTSTRTTSLALVTPTQILAESTWQPPHYNTEQLAPTITILLHSVGAEMPALTGVAVAQGPGSFTGLRIGIALAKGIATALGIPLYAVPSHDIIAAATPPHADHQLIAVLPAGRGNVLAARYESTATAHWERKHMAELLRWSEFVARLDERLTLINGELSAEQVEALQATISNTPAITLLPKGWRVRRAAFLAQLAYEYPALSPVDVFPLYVKAP
jgi:tRNA threonylcarbamoyladenosine biosynthesis protein TsaB